MHTQVLLRRRGGRSTLTHPVFGSVFGFGDLDRLMGELWRGFGVPLAHAQAQASVPVAPRMDVRETDDAYELHAEMPGLDAKDIEVEVENGVLTLSGSRSAESDEESRSVRHRESGRGAFRRAVRLPEGIIDEDAIRASCRHGVLTVTLPKAKHEVRQVPITAH